MKRLFKIGNERHDVGRVTFSWHPDGNFIASAGRNGIIHITDRHGDIIDEIPLSTSAPVLQLEWDRDGEYLAVLQEGNGVVPLWNLSSKRIVPLETNLKDPSFLAWSRTGPQLAIGTQKGNLLIYNKSRKQKIPIVGKHSKRIICGGWSLTGNKLVLASDDKTLTISNDNGDTLLQTDLRHVALEAKFTLTEKYSVMNNNNDNNKGGSNSRNESKTSSSYDRNNGGGSKDDVLISANLNGKSLLLYNIMDEKEDPLELTFAPKDNGNGCRYGDLMKHTWYSDDTVLVGFSDGYLLSVSTSPKQLGEEQYCNHIHNHELISFSYNPLLKRVATAGDDGVKIIDIHNFKEIKSDMITLDEIENSDIDSIGWSPDGQILTVSTVKGNIYNFLAKMSVLFANYKTSIAYLSSLREISIVDGVKKSRPIDVIVKLEPTLIAVGGKHVAAGMNNRVYYHRISNGADENTPPINEQEYIGIVREILLNNDYAVILTDSKAMIHPIEPSKDSNNQTKSFPNREEGSYSKVTCIALTDNFFFYGTEAGTVEIFFLSEWTLLSGIELRLENSIKKIYPNPYGTRIVVIDGANQVFLYNPVNGTGGAATNKAVTRFESTPAVIVNVLWDLEEKNIILLYDNNNCIHTYIYVQTSIEGSKLLKLGPVAVSGIGEISMKPDKVEILPGNTPVISCGGVLTCQAQSGNISSIIHPFFDRLDTSNRKKKASSTSSKRGLDDTANADRQEYELKSNYFCQCLALHKLEKAWELAVELDKKSFFLALSHKAMELLQIELATRIYVQLGDAGMVMALKQCELIEDKHLLAGQILLLFGDYQRAQDLFLSSSRPLTALEMRKDLIQWDQALKLAQILSPIQIPDICISYGQQLEARNEIDLSLKMYEEALHALDNDGNRVISDALIPTAMMGITRCQLRLGNVRQGIRQANELDDIQLFIECGTILENAKQYSEAASMYIKGKQYEKAALIYTKYLIKNDKNRINEMLLIIDKVNNDAINSAFGKACLSVQRYEDALNAYMRCNEIDKVVEILLKYLDSTQKAFDIVRKTPSSNASQIIADYCLSHQDYRGAIEFLLLANKLEDAFKLAQQQNIMDIYTSFFTDAIGNNDNTKEGEGANAANNKSLLLLMPSEDAIKVAQYYEKQQKYGLSGKYYAYSGQYAKALKLFLQCGDREIDSAIDIVGKSQNETLTHQLIDFLVGEKDGLPKDPKYIYRLYLALKKYEDAAKTALIIARQEQELGQYLTAHKVICETIRHLEDASIKVNLQLRENFILLHSYERAKGYVIKQDHINAARLLLRISQHISKFPLHKVKILTLTVIECSRAGLKTAAYEHAVTLVRPEYRSLLDNNFKKQIEGIVRKKSILRDGNYEEPPETTSPCPISGLMIPVYQLECPTTRDALPMCIISGKHMVLDDWCFCPVSKFPALYSEYVRYIRETTKKLDSASRDASESKVDSNQSGYTPSSGRMNEPQTDEGDEGNGNISNALVSATDMYLSAPDPILGKSVSVNDLILCTKEDATKYIQRYNNVFEKKKEDSNNNQKDDKDNKEDQKDGSSSPTKKEGNNEDEDDMAYSPVKSKKEGSSGTSKGKTGGVNPMNNKDGKISKAKLDRIQRQRRRRNGGDKR